jgi:uncharacterized membrane-anchored protein YitT (DUF2179 family)
MPSSASQSSQLPQSPSPISPRRTRTISPYTQILLLLAGSFIVAVSFNLFLLPGGIASGGVSGISILVERLLSIPPAYTQWALNIPILIAGWYVLGTKFALRSVLGSVMLPLFVLLTSAWPSPTDNVLLASVFGGLGVGLGLGLVFRGQGSTGGLDTAARILQRYTGLRIGLAMACIDGIVIASAGIVIAPEIALYALIALFVTSKTIDVVQTGLKSSKVAFIISTQPDEVAQVILTDVNRGLTELTARGGYTGNDKTVLMVVVGQHEVSKLKAAVQNVDPAAFVIISDTAEVLGEGFQTATP